MRRAMTLGGPDAVVAGAVLSPADQLTESTLVNLPATDEVVRRR
jgi:hypothetical protein